MHDPDTTKAERIQEILDGKYCKADSNRVTHKCEQVSKGEQQKLMIFLKRHKLLKRNEQLLNGTVGTWNTDSIALILKDPDCIPCHDKPYPIPQSQEKKLRKEVKRLCKQGYEESSIGLNKYPPSPMFTISKPDSSLGSLAA